MRQRAKGEDAQDCNGENTEAWGLLVIKRMLRVYNINVITVINNDDTLFNISN
jgi:hypothetical protein